MSEAARPGSGAPWQRPASWLGLLVAGVVLMALASPVALADQPSEGTGRPLTPFVLDDVTGQAYDVGQHVGRDVVVIAFWATWCKPCKLELKALHKLYLRYREQGLVVLAVSTDGPDSAAEVVGYTRKYSYQFPVLSDHDSALLERYNPRGEIPFSMVVDRQGRIVAVHQGYNPGDEVPLEAELKRLLAESPPSAPPAAGDGQASTNPYWVEPDSPRVEGTETLQFRYLSDNYNGRSEDDDVFAIHNKLTLSATWGGFTAGIRSDNTAFPGYDGEERCVGKNTALCPWEDDHRIERFWAEYRAPKLTVRVGDFYHQVGRGLVFSVRKIDELGTDTAIRGGRASVGIGPVTLQAWGGESNIQNMDLFDRGFVGAALRGKQLDGWQSGEISDVLVGGEVTVDLPYTMSIGGRALWVDYQEVRSSASVSSAETDLVAGGHFAVRDVAGVFSGYLEGAFIRNGRESTVFGKTKDEDRDGHAIYASATLTPARGLSILLEFKDYRRFNVTSPMGEPSVLNLPIGYHEPPTLERYDQILTTTENATGGRILAEYLIAPANLLVYANAVFYGWLDPNDDPGPDESVDNFGDKSGRTLHLYAGLERRWDSGLFINVSGGFRVEAKKDEFDGALAGDVVPKRRLWHIESDIQIPLGKAFSLGIRTNHRSEEKSTRKDDGVLNIGDASLTFGWAQTLSASLLYFYDEESGATDELKYQNFAAEVTWYFARWGQITVFGGRNTGGLVCANGVCRLLPAFEGVRTEFVARF